MIVKMLVGISRSDGFGARIGQEIEVDDELAQELMTNEQAEPVGAIKLPRPEAITRASARSHTNEIIMPDDMQAARRARKAVSE